MTNKPAPVEQLEELAGRVEQLSGPSKELDASIALVVGTAQIADGYTLEQVFGRECHAYAGTAYTASIDAAMQLCPDGTVDWLIRKFDDGTYGCDLEVIGIKVSTVAANGPNIAAALTAAALRAQSLLNQEKPK